MKSANIWKIIITQRITSFQMVNTYCYQVTIWAKYLFKMQGRLMNFIVTENRMFTDNVSDSTLQLTFKKFLLVKFWCSI